VTARIVGAELLVDDSVHETTSALANGMHVVMVAMPYNRAAAVELAARYGARFHDAADTAAALAAVMPE
jgi:beta-phosphoglucomutase-like phosphatase (HAD superfamily)